MQLSENFTLEEMTDSQTAVRLGIDEQFAPADGIKENLKSLCEDVLEPIRALLDSPIRVSSGYRCERLNEAIKGAKTSQHVKGQAVDFTCKHWTVEETYSKIKESGLVFDQLIQEFGHWAHISYTPFGGNRRECLRAIKVDGVTKYIQDVSEKV